MPWKLFVDSRKRIQGARSDTDSDFAIRLPRPITVRGHFYCDVCLFSNSFHVIRKNENDRFFLDELTSRTKRVTIIQAGQYNAYTLRDALVSALNTGRGVSGQYRVTYQEVLNKYSVDLVNPAESDVFRIWTDTALSASPTEWTSFAAADALQTANRPCGFSNGPQLYGDNVTVADAPGAPDLQPYKQLFLRSSLGGGLNDCLGPKGESDIIRNSEARVWQYSPECSDFRRAFDSNGFRDYRWCPRAQHYVVHISRYRWDYSEPPWTFSIVQYHIPRSIF
jgi:hypothetical protein